MLLHELKFFRAAVVFHDFLSDWKAEPRTSNPSWKRTLWNGTAAVNAQPKNSPLSLSARESKCLFSLPAFLSHFHCANSWIMEEASSGGMKFKPTANNIAVYWHPNTFAFLMHLQLSLSIISAEFLRTAETNMAKSMKGELKVIQILNRLRLWFYITWVPVDCGKAL